MKNAQVRELTKMAITAALYVVLCYAFAFMSYGLIQFRIAEILLILVLYNKKYCIPVILGTFIANMLNGAYDMIFGTLATVFVLLIIILIQNKTVNKIIIAPAAAIINGIIIGLMLFYIFKVPYALWFCMISVAAGEFAVVLIGVLVFHAVEKNNKRFIDLLRE
ncbi:MAG: QueT transporter family protein [Oscillospiraceae bacterium]|nr:QueT transporter family protein [Oscillospiraceae bacterium]